MDASNFFYGSAKASITPDRIKPRVFQAKVGQTAQVMNSAFSPYYRGHQAARQLSMNVAGPGHSEAAKKAIYDLQSKMQADLRAAADQWGWNDLKWAFEHMAKNNGNWLDDTWNGNGVCNIPIGVWNFLQEVEKRGGEVASSYREWQRCQSALTSWKQQQSWENLGTNLERAGTVVDKAGPKMWVMLGASETNAASYTGVLNKWIGRAGKVKGMMDAYLRVRYSPDGPKRALVAEVAAFIVQDLPIFGGAYADVIRGVPKAMTFFEGKMLITNRAIEGKFDYR